MIKLRKRVRKNKTQLYLDIYLNGIRKIEGLNIYLTKDKNHNKELIRLAEGIRAKKELELMNSEYGFVSASMKNLNFVEYLYKKSYEEGKLKSKCYSCAYVHLKKFTNGHVKFSQVNEEWLKSLETYIIKKVSANSTLKYFDVYRAVLNQAVREKIIIANPFNFFRTEIKKTETKKEFLTFPEIQKLAKTPCVNSEVKRAFLFSCYTGLRLSDIMNLEWSNIEGSNLDFKQKKTKNYEYLPLSPTALSLLHFNNSKIINLNEGKVFKLPTNQVVNSHIEKWIKKAGISKHITYHNSRHTFATLTLSSGIDLYTVSKLLGHTDIKHTQIYAKVINENKQKAVNSLPELSVV